MVIAWRLYNVQYVIFSYSFSAKSLEPTDAGTCTISDFKIEVLELLPDSKYHAASRAETYIMWNISVGNLLAILR